ncbi:hypothetical protein GOQ29_02915 [Clostridium sp. D2Q-14]|uniref:hypothetical protein n=1 Tax=Anaeromonas gelatinilytica TaxID=2683194 RepID=UPI00193BE30B|nr:hypothetical protein [Anaeromonas gelatinilytica]MBS4534561.1 hypothetical protein [Anaeromonas gelatinilytica]
MESRLERYLKEKEFKKKRRRKVFFILVLIGILFISILVVDGTLSNYLELSDINVFNYELEESTYKIELFGHEYKIKQDLINKIFNGIKNPILRIKNYVPDIIK